MDFILAEARPLIWVATVIYGVAFGVAGLSLVRNKRYFRGVLFTLILGGWVFQTLGLTVRGYEVQACPLGNPFEIIQFITWTAVGLFILIFPFYRINLLGFFITTFAFCFSLLSLLVPGWDYAYPTGIFGGNPWVELHAALAISSYGIFALLALIALMYLIQQYGLKAKQSAPFFRFLPSIHELDQVGLRLLSVGMLVLTVAIFVGSLYWIPHFENVSPVKITAAALLWCCCFGVWLLRLRGRLVARGFAWACLLLYIFALFSLWPVDNSRRTHKEAVAMATAANEP